MELKKVLVVDDEHLIRATTSMLLKRHDIETVCAAGGREGLELALKERPDLILLDIMMPEMDGWEVLEKLKSTTEMQTIPVVVFTAGDFEVSDEELQERGVKAIIRKPFHLKVLLKAIGFKASGGIHA